MFAFPQKCPLIQNFDRFLAELTDPISLISALTSTYQKYSIYGIIKFINKIRPTRALLPLTLSEVADPLDARAFVPLPRPATNVVIHYATILIARTNHILLFPLRKTEMVDFRDLKIYGGIYSYNLRPFMQ